MATKAQLYKTEQQRDANPPKPQSAPRPRRDVPVDTSKPGVSATNRKAGAGGTKTRNASKRAAKKGGAKLEDSKTGKPSRKSTRKSVKRAKRTSNLERKTVRRATSAKARAKRQGTK